ncbi:ATP-grasp domain-containing protein [Georgenia sp. Z1344]|uniref:ATP-grasp domain-containing protein n=1 Tax=Georgenia sp. Z1344 TaxID=3416706 RepID=UPI003CF9FE71
MIGQLAWVTARAARGTDDDEPLALAALRSVGVEVEVVDWDDPAVDWSRFDRAVLRSTWDYTRRLPEFMAWLESVDAVTEVVNPLALVRWSSDKSYLLELAEAGIPTIPTTVVPPGAAAEISPGGVVVKPSVGAGSRDVAAFVPGREREAATQVDRLHAAGRTALVQPLLTSVAVDGERALVLLDGELSHAARKRVVIPGSVPVAPADARTGTGGPLFSAETIVAHEATHEQAALARAVVDHVSGRWGVPTYARVDLVRDDDGQDVVLEVELVEPSLFLPQADREATHRLARALTR